MEWIKKLKWKIFFLKVWAQNVGVHYTQQSMVYSPSLNTKSPFNLGYLAVLYLALSITLKYFGNIYNCSYIGR